MAKVLYDNKTTLADGDYISLRYEIPPTDLFPGLADISSYSQVTWYKEIKTFDPKKNATHWVSTQDKNHGPISMRIDTTKTRWIVLTKAKAFGVHTGVYEITDIGALSGKKVRIEWMEGLTKPNGDGCAV